MATQHKLEPGVVLMVELDRSSPSFEKEAQAFTRRLERLQHELKFSHYVRAVQEEGDRMIIRIIPAATEPTGGKPEPAPRQSLAPANEKSGFERTAARHALFGPARPIRAEAPPVGALPLSAFAPPVARRRG